jgi:hypothetical protein
MKTAIVAGVIANKYLNGGAVWTRLNWALGMRKLGFRVYFLEQIESRSCRDEDGRPADFSGSANLDYFRGIMREFGLADSSALILDGGREVAGMSRQDLEGLYGEADLLINISGHLKTRPGLKGNCRKVYVDLDPGYTQCWLQAGLLDDSFGSHDHYFTIGEAIGTPECPIPTGDIDWQATRQPVVLDEWPVSGSVAGDRFTTVAAWRDSYGPLDCMGRSWGTKVHEFRKFISFPERVGQRCELALDIHPADHVDLDLLRRHGWRIRNPRETVPGPKRFRRYVQQSGAEFSVAKEVYAASRSGWFSDRTVRYLASGKPALVQDTGFSAIYPCGEGLLPFNDMDEAVSGAGRIARDYERHCRAARQLAEDWFDSDKVLGSLVERVGVLP